MPHLHNGVDAAVTRVSHIHRISGKVPLPFVLSGVDVVNPEDAIHKNRPPDFSHGGDSSCLLRRIRLLRNLVLEYATNMPSEQTSDDKGNRHAHDEDRS